MYVIIAWKQEKYLIYTTQFLDDFHFLQMEITGSPSMISELPLSLSLSQCEMLKLIFNSSGFLFCSVLSFAYSYSDLFAESSEG